MRNTEVDTDVLIVGAGPVGLFLANECARRGLRWRLIESRASQSEHSKALAIFPSIGGLSCFIASQASDPVADVPSCVSSHVLITGDERNRSAVAGALRIWRSSTQVGISNSGSTSFFLALILNLALLCFRWFCSLRRH